MIAYEVSRGILRECLVHSAIEAACFVDVTLQGVWMIADSGHFGVQYRLVDEFFPFIAAVQLETYSGSGLPGLA